MVEKRPFGSLTLRAPPVHCTVLGGGQAEVSQTRSSSLRTRVKVILTRMPYRYAVGLVMKTDEISEQGCKVEYEQRCRTILRLKDNLLAVIKGEGVMP
jgi:hypothetical protein